MAVDKPTEEQKVEHVAEAVRSSIRFPALANAGGAIGTVSIISSTAKDGDIINILALPLGLFLFGVFLTLLAAARALYTVSHMASGGIRTRWIRGLIGLKTRSQATQTPSIFFRLHFSFSAAFSASSSSFSPNYFLVQAR